MSKQEIIDYVMNTPYNTNPTILNQKLSEMEVQADWNQNDPTKADYVKNRPFWAGNPVEIVLLEETELFFYDGDAELPVTVSLEQGQTYNVIYNGTVYECIAWKHIGFGVTFIGNGSYIGSAEGNGEPFLIDGMVIKCMDDSATIKIVGIISEVHKIDGKYIDVPKAFSVITGHNEETDEPITYSASTVYVNQCGYNEDTYGRNTTLEYDGIRLSIPNENYAYCMAIDGSFDVRNLSKGDSVSVRITRNDSYYIIAAKGSFDDKSLYAVKLRDNSGTVGAIANGMYLTTAITTDGKLCTISVSGRDIELDDGYIDIIVKVIGTVTVS